jgi:hypothetical protein
MTYIKSLLNFIKTNKNIDIINIIRERRNKQCYINDKDIDKLIDINTSFNVTHFDNILPISYQNGKLEISKKTENIIYKYNIRLQNLTKKCLKKFIAYPYKYKTSTNLFMNKQTKFINSLSDEELLTLRDYTYKGDTIIYHYLDSLAAVNKNGKMNMKEEMINIEGLYSSIDYSILFITQILRILFKNKNKIYSLFDSYSEEFYYFADPMDYDKEITNEFAESLMYNNNYLKKFLNNYIKKNINNYNYLYNIIRFFIDPYSSKSKNLFKDSFYTNICKEYINDIKLIFDKAPESDSNMVLYRGISNNMEITNENIKEKIRGKSASLSAFEAIGFVKRGNEKLKNRKKATYESLMKINIKKGSKMILIFPFSYSSEEMEILLPLNFELDSEAPDSFTEKIYYFSEIQFDIKEIIANSPSNPYNNNIISMSLDLSSIMPYNLNNLLNSSINMIECKIKPEYNFNNIKKSKKRRFHSSSSSEKNKNISDTFSNNSTYSPK